MSHKDGRVMLSAWVDPVLRDYAREAAREAGVPLSRWVERAVQRAMARESADRAMDAALGLSVQFCACGRRLTECDGSRAGCTGQTGMPGVRDTKNPCDMFSPGKPTNGGCQGDGHYLCRECGLFDERSES